MQSPPRVLVVDDEEGVRNIVAVALEVKGYQVLTADGGREALERMMDEGGRIDLVILDVVMPDQSGPAVFRRMRAQWDVPVLFHSGYRGADSIAELLVEPRTGFLQKPWSVQQLVDAVEALLRA